MDARQAIADRYGRHGFFDRVFLWPSIEPVKRNKDGFRWIRHRFPIKDGITSMDAMRRDLTDIVFSPSPLFAALKRGGS